MKTNCNTQNKALLLALTAILAIFALFGASSQKLDAEVAAASFGSQPVASVNGEIITDSRLNDLLKRSWGYEAINQLIGNALVVQAAAKEGIQITRQDIADEEALTLGTMLPEVEGVSQKAMLDEILRSKQIPRQIWNETMKRNAMLRKLALKRIYITDEMLTDEFNNRFGLKVQVRHIQCKSMLDAQKIYTMLSQGADFVDMATKYSINADSAARGGLLEPFSRDEKSIPLVIRQSAFELADGQVSEIIQADSYYHLLRRERSVPPETDVKFEDIRAELQADLTERLIRGLMPRIIQELHDNANIVLIDPILKEQANIIEAQ